MDQNINDSKPHIWNHFIKNIISGIQIFYIHPHVPADIIKVFLDFRFSRRKYQSQQKLLIKIIYFAYRFAQNISLILVTSTLLTLKIICSRQTSKNLSNFTNFLGNMFLVGVRKRICTPLFLDTQELHSWSTLEANACIFLCI